MYKHIILLFFVIAHTCGINIAFCQEYYEKGLYRLKRSSYSDSLVSGFTMEEFASKYLPGFQIVKKRILDQNGRIFSLKRESDSMMISIRVGVYSSVFEAEEKTMTFLTELYTGVLTQGPIKDKYIGDNCWWASNVNTADGMITNITFIRKNAYFSIDTFDIIPYRYYPALLSLAQIIDDSLMKGASYVSLEKMISPPVLLSYILSKSELKMGESATLTLQGSDPRGKALEYYTLGVPIHRKDDPSNVFRIEATPANFENKQSVMQLIRMWVVNEDNFFSDIVRTYITF